MINEDFESLCNTEPPVYCSLCGGEMYWEDSVDCDIMTDAYYDEDELCYSYWHRTCWKEIDRPVNEWV